MADWLSDKQEQKLRLVAWPSPQDYNEAIQNPTSCFQDQELIGLTPQTTALGLPKPATGNFATVYNLSGGGKEFAVRCFLHPLKDERVRYAALSQCLQKHELSNCVRFEFVESGIKVHDQWRPIVKMEWAGGVSLVERVRQIKSQPNELNQLAENFKQMILRLSECGIAHGDLQHGNVIVDGEQIKLVDYDAVYVPELEGFTSNELGHPNYQHPQRSAEFFNDKLDRFSAWAIYASLKILSIDSSLWQVLNGGDECLLLRQTDYQNPENSKAFYVLETHPDPQVRLWSKHIRWLLSLPVEQLPNLDAGVVEPDGLVPVSPPAVSFDIWNQSLNSRANSSAQTASLDSSVGSVGLGALVGQAGRTISGAKPSSRSATDWSAVIVILVSLAFAGIYYATVVPMKDFVPKQDSKTAINNELPPPSAMQPMTVKNPALEPSQEVFQEGLQAQQNDLRELEIEKFKKALSLDKKDHGLSNSDRGECWHRIGHWQYDHDDSDHGQAAFQKAYDLYASTGLKYTNILDDVTNALVIQAKYLAATAKDFESLQAGLSGGGTDEQAGFFTGHYQMDEIRTLMPASLQQNSQAALETYAKICGCLESYDRSHDAKLDFLKEFVGMLLVEASDQLDKKQVDVAERLIELSGKAIDRNTQLMSLSPLRDRLVRRVSDARNAKRH